MFDGMVTRSTKEIKVGMRFGRLTVSGEKVMKRVGVNPPQSHSFWPCVCDCGKSRCVRSTELVYGHTKSCGCLGSDKRKIAATRHGMNGTREHNAWQAMKTRCLNANYLEFHLYGGRGVTICQEWIDSFEIFYKHMGPAPTRLHTIDRIDPSLGYCASNCRWATQTEQQNNKRNNVLMTHDGVTLTEAEWARKTGIARSTIQDRRNRGWSVADILTKPVRGRPRRTVA